MDMSDALVLLFRLTAGAEEISRSKYWGCLPHSPECTLMGVAAILPKLLMRCRNLSICY